MINDVSFDRTDLFTKTLSLLARKTWKDKAVPDA